MDKETLMIKQWLQNPENQAKARAAGLSPEKFVQPQQDEYEKYLMDMINSNKGNPSFQKEMYGQYLDYINPYNRNKRTQQEEESKYQIASDLASSDNPLYQEAGRKMFSELYPEYFSQSSTQGMPGQLASEPDFYGDARNKYKEEYLGISSPTQDEYKLYSYLTTAPNEAIDKYRAPVTIDERLGAGWEGLKGELQSGNPFTRGLKAPANFWTQLLNDKGIQRSRIGF